MTAFSPNSVDRAAGHRSDDVRYFICDRNLLYRLLVASSARRPDGLKFPP
ncbi:hypothetical protein NSU_3474 [Novosphingobium pentaromativorans US6-1]|uniref:Uncharacterized protein n=1 Tax=Novosphingobium pentaromativorans US6-1 TaxID=1088721 RepID=G6EGP3_9SPHN|nr:hypothetical protein NSU_3474 [Novosphingobium pentaromativorans US6-1]